MTTVDTNKETFDQYVKAGLWKPQGSPKWAGNYAASVKGLAQNTRKEFFEVTFVIKGYYELSFR